MLEVLEAEISHPDVDVFIWAELVHAMPPYSFAKLTAALVTSQYKGCSSRNEGAWLAASIRARYFASWWLRRLLAQREFVGLHVLAVYERRGANPCLFCEENVAIDLVTNLAGQIEEVNWCRVNSVRGG